MHKYENSSQRCSKLFGVSIAANHGRKIPANVNPPCTLRIWPVMYETPSDAKIAAEDAISSGSA